MEIPSIVQKTHINCSIDEVYKTLLSAQDWNQWFTDETTIDNHHITLVWTNWGKEKVTIKDGGRIINKIQNKHFSFEWSPGPELTTTVNFDLEEYNLGTDITVTETGYMEDHLHTLVYCAGGWGEALMLLKAYMEHGIKLRTSES
ncbi:SRPBCC family protein [Alkalicoccobacillus porphyridii]|uniref:SRPBCC domain-containing protein n=1 Tax=Alkalicoccobacillus porphyridii TaxID=2597270 RepID=A0A554A027_9BACI|nr:SRPBCC domain-containing protein [Alkalicoccobacillus porphyridii]TSB47049.1 SRPBCC domain-containing protein [Alkalicoccobacillus porphyridii]